jgi:hypothetical protein
MPTTTNFGWTTPADTDLVKDGAAAIRTLGNGVDTSLVDLKGGTTGQVLSKASNTDLDYTWVTPNVGDITEVQAGTGISVASGTGPIPVVTNSMATEITASGDIIVGTGSGTFDNLPIGTTGQVLTADTTVSPYKVKWASPAAAGFVGCSVYASSNQSINNATFTYLNFNSEEFDTDSFHDNSTNNSRITIPSGKSGKYLVVGNVHFAPNATGGRSFYLYKNGSADIFSIDIPTSSATYDTSQNFSLIRDLTAGDYLQLRVYQTSGGALDVVNGINDCRFQVQYLGA